MKYVLAIFLVLGLTPTSFAEETLSEKAKATAKSAKRGVKKGYNRAEEAMCGKLTGDSKAECLAKEAQNRAEEGVDVIKDKASEVKESLDSDK